MNDDDPTPILDIRFALARESFLFRLRRLWLRVKRAVRGFFTPRLSA